MKTVTVLSWNIWIDGDFHGIAEFLKKTDADILCLQEVKDDDPIRRIIPYLTALGYYHAFASVEKTWDGKVFRDGPAVFSKYNIVGTETFLLSEKDPRAAIKADIQIGNQIVHIFSTHLTHTHQSEMPSQTEQIENLLKVLPKTRTILAGDFNAVPTSTTILKVKEQYRESDTTHAPTWSVYPEGCSVCKLQEVNIRLDYIFVSKDLEVMSASVGESKASDHLPVAATVILQ